MWAYRAHQGEKNLNKDSIASGILEDGPAGDIPFGVYIMPGSDISSSPLPPSHVVV